VHPIRLLYPFLPPFYRKNSFGNLLTRPAIAAVEQFELSKTGDSGAKIVLEILM
jgi:hypothetical protein